MKTCSIDDCGSPVRARTWCNNHWKRWKRWGSPTGAMPPYEERFQPHVQRRGLNDCWLYSGKLQKKGYGVFWAGKEVLAHRYAYELAFGPVPEGMDVDHTCHNGSGCEGGACEHRRCVNPAHLDAVPPIVNRLRSHLHHAHRTHCVHGHEYTEENTHVRKTSAGGWGRKCRECARSRDRSREPRRPPAPPRPRPPCGTESAYGRHLRSGEQTCQPCRDAHAAHRRAQTQRRAA